MPAIALQILSSPTYSDTDGELNIERERRPEAEGGVEGEVEVQGDLSELRDDSTAFDGGVQDGITERTKALAKVLEDTSLRIIESIEGLFPCTRLAIAATGFQELPSQVLYRIPFFSRGNKLKNRNLLSKLIVDYRNFQNIFLSFKNVGHDSFFLSIHFIALLETFLLNHSF